MISTDTNTISEDIDVLREMLDDLESMHSLDPALPARLAIVKKADEALRVRIHSEMKEAVLHLASLYAAVDLDGHQADIEQLITDFREFRVDILDCVQRIARGVNGGQHE